ncbi:GNAT family N-acetyltransferase [Oryzobacter terrae]|uniref:GNAT family N-acetyltransferase n=1 Tax=Oryzobacter terrae TaxID=1620385 RepID=UPI00367324F8
MAVLRDATVHDLPALYRVCLLTGAAGRDASDAHADPDLPGHLFAGPYVVFPDALALVVQDAGGVAGYCLGVPDTPAFEDWMEEVWLPPLRERHPRGSGGTPADEGLIGWFHSPLRPTARFVDEYPAHLHVDLLPRLQGRGWGRRIMDAMTERLAAAGAGGVHVGVDPANTGALAFYERLGFRELGGPEGGRFLGLHLAPSGTDTSSSGTDTGHPG